MASNKIEYTIGFRADTAQAQKAITSLNKELNKIQSMEFKNLNLNEDLAKGAEAAQQLQLHLQAAIDTNTGKLNLNNFVQSLDNSGISLQTLATNLINCGSTGEQAFIKLANSIALTEAPLKRSQSILTSFGKTLKNTIKWEFSSNIVHKMESALSSAISYAKNLNSSLSDIRIVTGYSADEMTKFAEQANKAARNLSTTTKSYSDASLIYFQQGDDMATATEKAAITIKAANTAFSASASEMSEMLTAVWNSYQVGEDELERYVDIMAALGASTATSTEEIATAMQKVASTANTVGVSMEQMSSIIATVSSVTRESAETIGTAYKTILARIADLQLGNTLDDGTTLGTVSSTLKQIGVSVLDANGNLNEMGSIIEALMNKWTGLTEAQKVAVAEVVAGKRQYTQLMALMENQDMYQSNMKVANNAEGTLQTQADTYAESWEAASKRLQASIENIYTALSEDSAIISLMNALSELTNGVGEFIKTLGGAKGTIVAIGSVLLNVFSANLSTSIKNITASLKSFTTSPTKQYEASMQRVKDILQTTVDGSTNSNSAARETAKLIDLKTQLAEKNSSLTNSEKQAIEIALQGYAQQIEKIAELDKVLNDLDQDTTKTFTKLNLLSKTEDIKYGAGKKGQVGNLDNAFASAFSLQGSTAGVKLNTRSLNAGNVKNIKGARNSTTGALNEVGQSYVAAVKANTGATDSLSMVAQIEKLTDQQAKVDKFKTTLEGLKEVLSGTNFENIFDSFDPETLATSDQELDNFKVTLESLVQASSTDIDTIDKKIQEIVNKNSDAEEVAKQLKAYFDELREKGQLTAEAAEKINQALDKCGKSSTGLKNALDSSVSSSEKIINNITSVVSALGTITSTITTLSNAITTWDDEGTTTADRISKVVSALTVAITAGVTMVHTVNLISQSLANAGDAAVAFGTKLQASMGIIGLIAAVVVGIVTAISVVSQKAEEAKEKARELAKENNEKMMEDTETRLEEIEANKKLADSYNELLEQKAKGENVDAELAVAAQNLATAYGVTGAAIAALTGDYNEFTEAVNNSIIAQNNSEISNIKRAIAQSDSTIVTNPNNINYTNGHTITASNFLAKGYVVYSINENGNVVPQYQYNDEDVTTTDHLGGAGYNGYDNGNSGLDTVKLGNIDTESLADIFMPELIPYLTQTVYYTNQSGKKKITSTKNNISLWLSEYDTAEYQSNMANLLQNQLDTWDTNGLVSPTDPLYQTVYATLNELNTNLANRNEYQEHLAELYDQNLDQLVIMEAKKYDTKNYDSYTKLREYLYNQIDTEDMRTAFGISGSEAEIERQINDKVSQIIGENVPDFSDINLAEAAILEEFDGTEENDEFSRQVAEYILKTFGPESFNAAVLQYIAEHVTSGDLNWVNKNGTINESAISANFTNEDSEGAQLLNQSQIEREFTKAEANKTTLTTLKGLLKDEGETYNQSELNSIFSIIEGSGLLWDDDPNETYSEKWTRFLDFINQGTAAATSQIDAAMAELNETTYDSAIESANSAATKLSEAQSTLNDINASLGDDKATQWQTQYQDYKNLSDGNTLTVQEDEDGNSYLSYWDGATSYNLTKMSNDSGKYTVDGANIPKWLGDYYTANQNLTPKQLVEGAVQAYLKSIDQSTEVNDKTISFSTDYIKAMNDVETKGSDNAAAWAAAQTAGFNLWSSSVTTLTSNLSTLYNLLDKGPESAEDFIEMGNLLVDTFDEIPDELSSNILGQDENGKITIKDQDAYYDWLTNLSASDRSQWISNAAEKYLNSAYSMEDFSSVMGAMANLKGLDEEGTLDDNDKAILDKFGITKENMSKYVADSAWSQDGKGNWVADTSIALGGFAAKGFNFMSSAQKMGLSTLVTSIIQSAKAEELNNAIAIPTQSLSDLQDQLTALNSIDVTSMPKAGTTAWKELSKALDAAGLSMTEYQKADNKTRQTMLNKAKNKNISDQIAAQKKIIAAYEKEYGFNSNDTLADHIGKSDESAFRAYMQEIETKEQLLDSQIDQRETNRQALIAVYKADLEADIALLTQTNESIKKEAEVLKSAADTLTNAVSDGYLTSAVGKLKVARAYGDQESSDKLIYQQAADMIGQSTLKQVEEQNSTIKGATDLINNSLMQGWENSQARLSLQGNKVWSDKDSLLKLLGETWNLSTEGLNELNNIYDEVAKTMGSEATITDFVKALITRATEDLEDAQITVADLIASMEDSWDSLLVSHLKQEQTTAQETVDIWTKAFNAIKSAREAIFAGKTAGEGLGTDAEAIAAYLYNQGDAANTLQSAWEQLNSRDADQISFSAPWTAKDAVTNANSLYSYAFQSINDGTEMSMATNKTDFEDRIVAGIQRDRQTYVNTLTTKSDEYEKDGESGYNEWFRKYNPTTQTGETWGGDIVTFKDPKDISNILTTLGLEIDDNGQLTDNQVSLLWSEFAATLMAHGYEILSENDSERSTQIDNAALEEKRAYNQTWQESDATTLSNALTASLTSAGLESLGNEDQERLKLLTGQDSLSSITPKMIAQAQRDQADAELKVKQTELAQAKAIIGEVGTTDEGLHYDKSKQADESYTNDAEAYIDGYISDGNGNYYLMISEDEYQSEQEKLQTLKQEVETLKGTSADAQTALHDAYAAALDLTNEEFDALKEKLKDKITIKIDDTELDELTYKVGLAEKGFESLQDISKDTWKILKKTAKSSATEYAQSLNTLKTAMSQIFNSDISTEFAENHIEQMEKMANGTEEEAAAAQDAIEDDLIAAYLEAQGLDAITINIDGNATNLLTVLQDSFDQWDNEEIGFTIDADTSSVLSGLQDCLNAGTMTAEQVSAALNGIGWEPEITWKTVVVGDLTEGAETVTVTDPNTQLTYQVRVTEDMETGKTITIPVIGSASKISSPGGGKRKKSSGGGGGGGSSKKIDKKKPEDEIDRYHHVKEDLERLSDQLDEVSKKKERVYGKGYLDYLKQEIDLLDQECDTYQRYIDEAEEYLALDTSRVESLGAVFDEFGNISNYDEVMMGIINKYNEFVDLYNAGKADDDDKEKWDEWYEEKKKWIENYEETVSTIYDQQNNLLEAQNKMSEKTLETIQYKVELHVDLSDQEKKLLEYLDDKYDKILEDQGKAMDNLVKETEIAVDNLAALGDEKEALDEAFAAGALNQADYVDGLKELNDDILENLKNIEKYKEEVEEFYENVLKLASDELDNQTKKLQSASEAMKSYISLLKLVGKGSNFKELTKFYDAQYQYNLDQLKMQKEYYDVLKDEEKYYLERLESAEGLTETEREQYEALAQEIADVNKEILSDTEQALQQISEAFTNEIEIIFENLNEQIAGTGNSIDDLADAYSYYQEEQERYVTTAKKLYEVSKLNRDIENTMNDVTSKVHKNLLAELQDRINKQSEMNELTEYDIEMNRLQYELLLKKIALEEAENAKSTVRLTRDAGGNYVYQYTADEDDIEAKRQEYEDVLQQINEQAVTRAQDLESQLLEIYQNTISKIKEIAQDETLTQEEKYDKIQTIMNQFKDETNYIQEQYQTAADNLITSNLAISKHYGEELVEHSENAKNGLNQTIAEMIDKTEELQDAMENVCANQVPAALDSMQAKIDEVTSAAELDYDSMTDSLEDYNKVAKDAKKQNTETVNVLEDDVLPAIHDVTDAWDAYTSKLKSVISTYEDMYSSILKVIQAQAQLSGASSPTYLKGKTTSTSANSSTPDIKNAGSGGGDGNGGGDSSGGGYTDFSGSKGTLFITYKTLVTTGTHKGSTNLGGTPKGPSSLPVGGSGTWNMGCWNGYGKGGFTVSDRSLASVTANTITALGAGSVTITARYWDQTSSATAGGGGGTRYNAKFATGGLADFTGPAWLDGTPTKPEIVLNPDDTENLLAAVQGLRSLDSTTMGLLNRYITNSSLAMSFGLMGVSAGSVNGLGGLQQEVHITAEFPNATNSAEIQDAFDNIINRAAQYITTKK